MVVAEIGRSGRIRVHVKGPFKVNTSGTCELEFTHT